MDIRKENGVVHSDKSMVIAKNGSYYVAVVKMDQRSDKEKFIVIVTEQVSIKKQIEIVTKSFSNPKNLSIFLHSIVPEYFLEQNVVKQVYKAIKKLVANKREH